jgi:hypothetical protein
MAALDKGRRSIAVDRTPHRATVRCRVAEHYVAVGYAVDPQAHLACQLLETLQPYPSTLRRLSRVRLRSSEQ